MEVQYQPQIIEKQAQLYWQQQQCFAAKELLNKEKFYCLSMFPYPSGNLHMGHIRNYTLGDVIARYQWLLGKEVLHPIGWDAFGLPAENAAIAHNLPPAVWTEKNIAKMRTQFERMGYSFDWNREIRTCDPAYYHWEQWFFLQLYQKNLVYKKNAFVNWDPVDQTVLANEQVIDGRGWRSGALVERKEIPQWFIKITDYAEQLLTDLDQLTGWPERVRTMQRNWIGRSEGINIDFLVGKEKLTIFTTRIDTLFGVSYIAIAPEHPIAQKEQSENPEIAAFIKKATHTKVAEAEIATQEKEGICLKAKATHPLTGKKIPIWVTNFVLMDYGSGAVMAVPAHDERDHEFALKYHIKLIPVIKPSIEGEWDYQQAAYTGPGILLNSNEFSGLDSKEAKKSMSSLLINKKQAAIKINYRLRDWGISRQRYWGTPIPIIHCKNCGEVPVPEKDLPVILPVDLIPNGSISPLQLDPNFYKTACPQCGVEAKRETDTMDTFVESSWYYARYCCFDQNKVMLDDRTNYWSPVDQYIGGVEHAILHLLYARFFHKALRDFNLLNSREPFTNLLTQGMVLKDGHKMSKSKGNVVAPEKLIKQYGADTVRLFIIFAAPPEQGLEWSDHGVEGAYRFLRKLWHYSYAIKPKLPPANSDRNFLAIDQLNKNLKAHYQQIYLILQQANTDMQRQQFNTVVSGGMKLFNLLSKIPDDSEAALQVIQEGISILLRLLSPTTPHLSHYLWKELGFGDDILKAGWPKINPKALQFEEVTLVVQINGKLRGEITVQPNSEEAFIKQKVLKENSVQRHLEGKAVKKIIVVPNKLVNIVV